MKIILTRAELVVVLGEWAARTHKLEGDVCITVRGVESDIPLSAEIEVVPSAECKNLTHPHDGKMYEIKAPT